jgi:diadenosine tetraphosphate (Ap4A) HIT family hydrolase
MFELDATLKSDTYVLGEWPLSLVLLHRDSNYPWCILVPKCEQASEIYDLSEAEQLLLLEESRYLARAMVSAFSPHKLNIAALGNIVKQLHIHHIARFEHDQAWPQPVWGVVQATSYSEDTLASRLGVLRQLLGKDGLSW